MIVVLISVPVDTCCNCNCPCQFVSLRLPLRLTITVRHCVHCRCWSLRVTVAAAFCAVQACRRGAVLSLRFAVTQAGTCWAPAICMMCHCCCMAACRCRTGRCVLLLGSVLRLCHCRCVPVLLLGAVRHQPKALRPLRSLSLLVRPG